MLPSLGELELSGLAFVESSLVSWELPPDPAVVTTEVLSPIDRGRWHVSDCVSLTFDLRHRRHACDHNRRHVRAYTCAASLRLFVCPKPQPKSKL